MQSAQLAARDRSDASTSRTLSVELAHTVHTRHCAKTVETPAQSARITQQTPQRSEKIVDPQLRVHDLRHSCATLLFTMGVPPATVQRILRHRSITVTIGTYVEVIEAVQRDALDSMGTLFAHVDDDSQGSSW